MNSPVFAGFLSGLVLIVAIGAQNAFVLRQGLGRRHVLPIALTCALSDALLIAAGIAGLGALIQAAPSLLALARYGGAAFLGVYGLLAARRAWSGGALAVGGETGGSLGAALLTCLGFTLLNPHVYLDTVILLGALAQQHGDAGRWPFGAGAAAASLLWFLALGFGARLLTPLFARPLSWRVLDSLIAVVMLSLAGALLIGDSSNSPDKTVALSKVVTFRLAMSHSA